MCATDIPATNVLGLPYFLWRHGGLMVSVHASGFSNLDLSSGLEISRNTPSHFMLLKPEINTPA